MNAPLRHADTVRQVDFDDPRDIARVEAFVEELDGSVFHRPLWLQAIAHGTGNSARGLIAERGGFEGLAGDAQGYEYWSLSKAKDAENRYGFGYVDVPLKVGRKTSGVAPEEFLPLTADKLTLAINRFIKGNDSFTARENPDYPAYDTYDQLMRLDEWIAHQDGGETA